MFLSPTDSVSLLLFLRCQSVSQCGALRLSVQLVQLSSKLICLRATFPCPFTLFSSFINLIAHSLISLCLSPSLVLWPIPKGSIVKVSQPISVQLMYCPLPNMTSIVSQWTSPLCSRTASQKKGLDDAFERGGCIISCWPDCNNMACVFRALQQSECSLL